MTTRVDTNMAPAHGRIRGIGELLASISRQKNWYTRLSLHRVFGFWGEMVGEELAAQAQPSVIRGWVLWVRVSDPVWMQQLQFNKIVLLDKINQRLHDVRLHDIRFRIDATLGRQQPRTPAPSSPVGPDRAKQLQFETMISFLTDEATRQSLTRLWIKFHTTP